MYREFLFRKSESLYTVTNRLVNTNLIPLKNEYTFITYSQSLSDATMSASCLVEPVVVNLLLLLIYGLDHL